MYLFHIIHCFHCIILHYSERSVFGYRTFGDFHYFSSPKSLLREHWIPNSLLQDSEISRATVIYNSSPIPGSLFTYQETQGL